MNGCGLFRQHFAPLIRLHPASPRTCTISAMKSAITALALIASCASAQPYVETMNVGELSENLAMNSEEAVEH